MAYLNKVTVDLVAVEVGIVRITIRVVHTNCVFLHVSQDPRLVCHDTWLMEGRLSVDKKDIAIYQVSVHPHTRVRE